MKKLITLIYLLTLSFSLFSQETTNTKADTLRKDALNVFISASDYMKQEVPFINYVRDKEVADLIVIDTYQHTGSGGGEYTFYVEGNNRYKGIRDTVSFNIYPFETDDEVREKGVRVFKMGLMKYLINTPLADYIDINFSEAISDEVSTDRWNSWVFQTSLGGGMGGSQSVNGYMVGTELNISRVTQKWKLNFNTDFNFTLQEIDYGSIQATSIKRDGRGSLDIVRSLSEHWSLGISADAFTNLYTNHDLGLSIEPVIEYNFYPYAEAERRRFTVFYSIGYNYSDYADTTAYFKVKEGLASHKIMASYRIIEQWGHIGASAQWSNYLKDFSLNRLSLGGEASIRVAKGLNIRLQTGYSFIHDQISLRKGEATVEEVLLQQNELSTTFSFMSSIGISYTFGSLYNNVVNPRLDVIF